MPNTTDIECVRAALKSAMRANANNLSYDIHPAHMAALLRTVVDLHTVVSELSATAKNRLNELQELRPSED